MLAAKSIYAIVFSLEFWFFFIFHWYKINKLTIHNIFLKRLGRGRWYISSSLLKIRSHSKKYLLNLPESVPKVCVVVFKVTLVLRFGPNRDFRLTFRLGPSWTTIFTESNDGVVTNNTFETIQLFTWDCII
jgi:hypothetical protein